VLEGQAVAVVILMQAPHQQVEQAIRQPPHLLQTPTQSKEVTVGQDHLQIFTVLVAAVGHLQLVEMQLLMVAMAAMVLF